MVGNHSLRAAFSGILSSGGHLHSDGLSPDRVIAHYHKVDLILTLLDRRSHRPKTRRADETCYLSDCATNNIFVLF